MRGRIYYGGRACPHIYLCFYHPVEWGPDPVSQSLIRFKYGLCPDTEEWIACALGAIKHLPPDTLIVRALHHDECYLTGTEYASLDDLGRGIATYCGGWYFPALLGKRRPTIRFRDLHSKQRREEEMDGVYYLTTEIPPPSHVLVIDDIVTTGTTVVAILKVLAAAMPAAKFHVFSLAKASPKRFH